MGSGVRGISVIGLGKLGSPLAAVMASKGFAVVGVDVNEKFVEQLNDGEAPVQEPGLQELIDSSRDRLRSTTDVAAAVHDSDDTVRALHFSSNILAFVPDHWPGYVGCMTHTFFDFI